VQTCAKLAQREIDNVIAYGRIYKMKKWNIEEGFKRIYIIIWVLYAVFYEWQFDLIENIINVIEEAIRHHTFLYIIGVFLEIFQHAFFILVVPYLISEGIKFVYEGFKKK